jgi:hypothetical protein
MKLAGAIGGIDDAMAVGEGAHEGGEGEGGEKGGVENGHVRLEDSRVIEGWRYDIHETASARGEVVSQGMDGWKCPSQGALYMS